MKDTTGAPASRSLAGGVGAHLRANVIGYLALFVALGGTSAWAADKITAKDIAKNAVRAKHIKKNAVKGPKIARGAVGSSKLAGGSVVTQKLRDGSVVTQKLADGSVVTQKLADGSVVTQKLADGAVITQKLADGSVTAAKLAPDAAPVFTDYEYVERIHNVPIGAESIVTSAPCPAGKKILGGGFAIQDSSFHVTFANTQVNDVYGLTAVLLPDEPAPTTPSQAFVKAICARVVESP
jgi:hypothetical protein